jgi:transcription initiation factor TFIID subunit 3
MEDYLSCTMTLDAELTKLGLRNLALMKKHSKTGVDSRYQGTILGKPADLKPIKIEGGPVDSIEDWCQKTREKATKTRDDIHEDQEMANHVDEVVYDQDDEMMEPGSQ